MSVSNAMRHQELLRLLPLVSLDFLKDLSLEEIQKLEASLSHSLLVTQRARALKAAGSNHSVIMFN